MTESLHTHLVSVLNDADIHPALSEDEIDSYPYVTFELPVEYRYTKDGPYKIVGNLTIRSVSDDFDQADVLRAGIESAISQGFGGPSNSEPAEEAGGEEEEVSEVMPADPDEETDPTEEPATPLSTPARIRSPQKPRRLSPTSTTPIRSRPVSRTSGRTAWTASGSLS